MEYIDCLIQFSKSGGTFMYRGQRTFKWSAVTYCKINYLVMTKQLFNKPEGKELSHQIKKNNTFLMNISGLKAW